MHLLTSFLENRNINLATRTTSPGPLIPPFVESKTPRQLSRSSGSMRGIFCYDYQLQGVKAESSLCEKFD